MIGDSGHDNDEAAEDADQPHAALAIVLEMEVVPWTSVQGTGTGKEERPPCCVNMR